MTWITKMKRESIQVRVIKFALDSGEIETLITNIKDKRLGKKAFLAPLTSGKERNAGQCVVIWLRKPVFLECREFQIVRQG